MPGRGAAWLQGLRIMAYNTQNPRDTKNHVGKQACQRSVRPNGLRVQGWQTYVLLTMLRCRVELEIKST